MYTFDTVIIRIKEADRKKALCKKHSAMDMWWVTSKAQNGEIRIVPILEILRKPIGTAVGQDSRYNIRYSLEPIKAIVFCTDEKIQISVPPVCYYNTNQINFQEKYFES